MEMFGLLGPPYVPIYPMQIGPIFSPMLLHFWRNPKASDGNAELRRAALCIFRGARKRSRVIRHLAGPEKIGDLRKTVSVVMSLTSATLRHLPRGREPRKTDDSFFNPT